MGRRIGKIDEIDLKILTELSKSSNISIPKLAKKLNIHSSVIYSRIKRLVKRELIKRFTIEVNEELLGYNVTAIMGLNIDAKLRESITDALTKLPEVREISEVTGRFDMILFLKTKSLDHLHDIILNKIATTQGVTHTETFLEMKKTVNPPIYIPAEE